MPKDKLTDLYICNYKTPKKRTEIYDTSRGSEGLALRVTSTGHKSFVYRYRFGKKVKRYTLGSYPAVSLTQARKEVKKLSYQVSSGVDPSELKKDRRSTPEQQTFKSLTDLYKVAHLPSLRKKTVDEHTRIIDRELIPALGSRPINEISKPEIIAILDKKGLKDGKKTMANRLRSRLQSIFEFGVDRGMVKINPVTGTKPFRDGETKRSRHYDDKEIHLLWQAFEQQNEPAQSILKLLLLTGQRKTETMRMEWSHLSGDVWTIPAELAKGKRKHKVPLSAMAMDIIDKMRFVNGNKTFVFASPTIKNQPMVELKRRVKKVREYSNEENKDFKVADFRIHDLRRTAATNMAKLEVDRTVLGKILNHKGLAGDGLVTAIYDQHQYMDEKKEALEKWAEYLDTIINA